MRPAVLHGAGETPRVEEFDDPRPVGEGQVDVDVLAAGVNPVDLALASGALGDPQVPQVVGQEGVGTVDGRRVYFNPPIKPFGSIAERCVADEAGMFDVPEALDDGLAVAMGIAGLAAWLSLEFQARVDERDQVLVLGASGVVGQIAVQGAKLLGGRRVVAAARSEDALAKAQDLGADATVTIGSDDDAAALRDAADGGYDVVIDPLYGAPFLAALSPTAERARLVTIGQSAGGSADISFRALQSRTHIAHYNASVPVDVRRDAYARLAGHAAAGRVKVGVETFPLDRASEAWAQQASSPHRKLVVVP